MSLDHFTLRINIQEYFYATIHKTVVSRLKESQRFQQFDDFEFGSEFE